MEIGFQCPDNGWYVRAEYDEETHKLTVEPIEGGWEIEQLGAEKCAELRAEAQKWCDGVNRTRVPNGLVADDILRKAGVHSSDLFGYVECPICSSDQGEYTDPGDPKHRWCWDCRWHHEERVQAAKVMEVLEQD